MVKAPVLSTQVRAIVDWVSICSTLVRIWFDASPTLRLANSSALPATMS